MLANPSTASWPRYSATVRVPWTARLAPETYDAVTAAIDAHPWLVAVGGAYISDLIGAHLRIDAKGPPDKHASEVQTELETIANREAPGAVVALGEAVALGTQEVVVPTIEQAAKVAAWGAGGILLAAALAFAVVAALRLFPRGGAS